MLVESWSILTERRSVPTLTGSPQVGSTLTCQPGTEFGGAPVPLGTNGFFEVIDVGLETYLGPLPSLVVPERSAGRRIACRAAGGQTTVIIANTQVPRPQTFSRITSGGHGCGVTIAGAAMCWGGYVDSADLVVDPVPIGYGSGVTAVDSFINGGGGCVLVSGRVECWGQRANSMPPLGSPSLRPKVVAGLESGVTDLSLGYSAACAIQAGVVKCWGSGYFGELGNGPEFRETAEPVPGLPTGATSLADDGSCAVVAGAAWCWGWSTAASSDRSATLTRPRMMAGLESGVTGISANIHGGCAVVNGGVKCWGDNVEGQLGNGPGPFTTVPTDVPGLSRGVTSVSVSSQHVCAIVRGGPVTLPGFAPLSDGVVCWGLNNEGQLGRRTMDASATSFPGPVPNLSGVTALSAFDYGNCALVGGLSKCWGTNHGKFGNGSIGGLALLPVGYREGTIGDAVWNDDSNVRVFESMPEPTRGLSGVAVRLDRRHGSRVAHDDGHNGLYVFGPLPFAERPTASASLRQRAS